MTMTHNSRFKFRAFVRGYIVDVVSIDFVNQYITWDDNQYDRCVPPNKCYEIASFDEIKLLQWTGLYDKNGKEVFEGDILRLGETASFVVWCLDRWRFNSYMERGTLDLYDYVNPTNGKELAEVIGSIFTHPELVQTIK